jgi:hypothetical protein
MQLNKDEVTNEVQSTILSVFRDFFEDELAQDSGNHIYATKADTIVGESVVNADEDPGEWSREAMTIIYHADGMPSYGGNFHIELWSKVSDVLDDYYVEPINGEVSAVYSL